MKQCSQARFSRGVPVLSKRLFLITPPFLLCFIFTACSQGTSAENAQTGASDGAIWENSLGMRFASVESHPDLLFSVWQTRVADFRAFVADTERNDGYDYRAGRQPEVVGPDGWAQRGWEYGWDQPGFRQGDDHPVTCVSWKDAQVFCAWLTRVDREAGRIGRRQFYRLPTNREWSSAAGIRDLGGIRSFSRKLGNLSSGRERTTDPPYPWGHRKLPPPGWGNFGGEDTKLDVPPWWDVIPGYYDGYSRTSPVGAFGPKHGALCDMSGNVWEWIEGAADARGHIRMLRGGSWASSTANLRLSHPSFQLQHTRRSNFGFRVVLDSTGLFRFVNPLSWLVARAAEASSKLLSKEQAETDWEYSRSDAEREALHEGDELVAEQHWTVPEVGLRMKWIPPGRFKMGSTRRERRWATGAEARGAAHMLRSERNPVSAEIASGFWMGEFPVTVAQWKVFIDETDYKTVAERRGRAWASSGRLGLYDWVPGASWRNPGFEYYIPRDYDPVVCLAWEDADAFCAWLTHREREAGRLPADLEYRLPAEVEWEYAARGGLEGTRYWWGNCPHDGEGRLNVANVDGTDWLSPRRWPVHWGRSDGYSHIAPVDAYGSRGRNRFGLAGMLGNVRELCLDGYDPAGPHPEPWFDNVSRRVVRGSDFTAAPGEARCAFRSWSSGAASHQGFRVALGHVIPRPGGPE